MTKNKKIIAILSCLLISCVFVFAACRDLHEDELAIVGRYDLTNITSSDIEPQDYDYNFIVLDDEGKFELHNLSGGVEYQAKGKWSLSGQVLTMKMSGIFTKKEVQEYKDGKIYLKGELEGHEIILEYSKVTE